MAVVLFPQGSKVEGSTKLSLASTQKAQSSKLSSREVKQKPTMHISRLHHHRTPAKPKLLSSQSKTKFNPYFSSQKNTTKITQLPPHLPLQPPPSPSSNQQLKRVLLSTWEGQQGPPVNKATLLLLVSYSSVCVVGGLELKSTKKNSVGFLRTYENTSLIPSISKMSELLLISSLSTKICVQNSRFLSFSPIFSLLQDARGGNKHILHSGSCSKNIMKTWKLFFH